MIAVVGTFNSELNNGCESGHPFLVPDLREKVFSLSSLNMLIAMGFFLSLYQVEEVLFLVC